MEDNVNIPEEIEQTMFQTFESKKGDEQEIPE